MAGPLSNLTFGGGLVEWWQRFPCSRSSSPSFIGRFQRGAGARLCLLKPGRFDQLVPLSSAPAFLAHELRKGIVAFR